MTDIRSMKNIYKHIQFFKAQYLIDANYDQKWNLMKFDVNQNIYGKTFKCLTQKHYPLIKEIIF